MSFGYRTLGLVLKLIFGSVIVGSLVGLILPFVLKLFGRDGAIELWELGLTLVIVIVILAFFVRVCSHHLSQNIGVKLRLDFNFTQFRFLIIPGILTCIIPMGGPLFGGTGNESMWGFMLLGIVGSIFWSLPLVLWILIHSLSKRTKNSF